MASPGPSQQSLPERPLEDGQGGSVAPSKNALKKAAKDKEKAGMLPTHSYSKSKSKSSNTAFTLIRKSS